MAFIFLQEFEVIAQIKLLQSACNNYSFTQEDRFVDWFHSLERLSEAERCVSAGSRTGTSGVPPLLSSGC